MASPLDWRQWRTARDKSKLKRHLPGAAARHRLELVAALAAAAQQAKLIVISPGRNIRAAANESEQSKAKW